MTMLLIFFSVDLTPNADTRCSVVKVPKLSASARRVTAATLTVREAVTNISILQVIREKIRNIIRKPYHFNLKCGLKFRTFSTPTFMAYVELQTSSLSFVHLKVYFETAQKRKIIMLKCFLMKTITEISLNFQIWRQSSRKRVASSRTRRTA
jgi:hypothetical protein